uniref:Uncharacterized protein n=1 Tax=Anguilla anguilla TaxID=7936 RepID=A0A0E9VES5_ANGAN
MWEGGGVFHVSELGSLERSLFCSTVFNAFGSERKGFHT